MADLAHRPNWQLALVIRTAWESEEQRRRHGGFRVGDRTWFRTNCIIMPNEGHSPKSPDPLSVCDPGDYCRMVQHQDGPLCHVGALEFLGEFK